MTKAKLYGESRRCKQEGYFKGFQVQSKGRFVPNKTEQDYPKFDALAGSGESGVRCKFFEDEEALATLK